MNGVRILAGEFLISVSISCWQAIKSGYMPFPPVITHTGVAFGILGGVAIFSPEIAAVLGTGFLLAQIVKQAGKNVPFPGVIDPTTEPDLTKLHWINWKGK